MVDVSDESLRRKFEEFWYVVEGRRPTRPDIRLPLFHLNWDGFWTPLNEQHTPASTRWGMSSVQLDPEFHNFMQDPSFRKKFAIAVISNFPDTNERRALDKMLGL